MRTRRFPTRLAQAFAFAAALATSVAACAQSPPAGDPGARVLNYLRGLGLDRVAAVHLENELRAAQDESRKKALARDLADLYASLLTETGIDEQEFQRRSQTLDRLVKEFPAIDSPSLAIIRLQGEFQRGEEALNLWLANGGDAASHETARSVFSRIGPALADAASRLDAERKSLQERIDALEAGDPELDRQFDRVNEAWNRAHFFAGWAEYYRWLVAGRSDRAALEASIGAFERFLNISGEPYPDVRPEWLALEVQFRSRAAIGLEMALVALGDKTRADMVHAWLQHFSVPASVRDELANWRLTAYLNAQQWDAAIAFADTALAGFSPEPTQGKVTFCATLIRGAYGSSDVPPDKKSRLAELGIGRLARMRVFNVLDELVKRYGIGDEAVGDGFYLQYLAAKRAYDDAKESQKPEDFDRAIELLDAVLTRAEAQEEAGLRGEGMHSLGYALFQRERFKEAAERYEESWKSLKEAKRESASEAAKGAFASYLKLAEKEKSYNDAAVSVLERILAEAPNSEFGKQAQAYLPRLRAMASSPEDALATWKKVPPGDPRFDEAQREMTRLYGQMAVEAEGAKAQERIAGEASAFVSSVLGSSASPSTKLDAALLGARLAATSKSPDWEAAASLLDQVSGAVANVPADSLQAREWRLLRMNAAANSGDDARAQREAQWLTENAAGTAQEKTALVLQAINAVKWNLSEERLEEIYERIAEGATPATLTTDKNARAALYRLAQKAQGRGDAEEAERRIVPLLAAMPNELDYLLLQAKNLFAQAKFVESRELALKILRGRIDSKDPRWWEAKYLQIASLAQTDPGGAEKVYRQFRLLYPQIENDEIRERFDSLAANWSSP